MSHPWERERCSKSYLIPVLYKVVCNVSYKTGDKT